jgi:hypothetical protein
MVIRSLDVNFFFFLREKNTIVNKQKLASPLPTPNLHLGCEHLYYMISTNSLILNGIFLLTEVEIVRAINDGKSKILFEDDIGDNAQVNATLIKAEINNRKQDNPDGRF